MFFWSYYLRIGILAGAADLPALRTSNQNSLLGEITLHPASPGPGMSFMIFKARRSPFHKPPFFFFLFLSRNPFPKTCIASRFKRRGEKGENQRHEPVLTGLGRTVGVDFGTHPGGGGEGEGSVDVSGWLSERREFSSLDFHFFPLACDWGRMD